MDLKQAKETDLPQERRGSHGGGRPWGECADHLRSNPGQWFEVEEHGMTGKTVQVYSSRIRLGLLKPFEPKGSFEARFEGDRLWARYVGDPS